MQPGCNSLADASRKINLELDFINQGPDEKVMARTQWFKFLKLAFDELMCEYPAYLTPKGISFILAPNTSCVDCIDRELLLQTITMNTDQVPLMSLSEFKKCHQNEKWISLDSMVAAINVYVVKDIQTSWESADKSFSYLTWDDVIDCLLAAASGNVRAKESFVEVSDTCVQQTKLVLLKDNSALIDMSLIKADSVDCLTTIGKVMKSAEFVNVKALSLACLNIKDVRFLLAL